MSDRQNLRGPEDTLLTSANTFSSVDKNHWDCGHVELRLDDLIVLRLLHKQVVIRRMEDGPSDGLQLGENVPSRSVVFASSVTGTVLTIRFEEVEIICTNIVLCQIDNGSHKRLFTVVVSGMFRNITNELGHLREMDKRWKNLRRKVNRP